MHVYVALYYTEVRLGQIKIWLESNVMHVCNDESEDKIFAENFRTRLRLKSMKECLQDRRLQWFGHLEGMEESACSSKCKTFKVGSIFPRRQTRKTWNEVWLMQSIAEYLARHTDLPGYVWI